MRTHLENAAYGLLDYAAYPAAMLIVAPIILRHMGVAQYGIWTVATAAVSVGSVLGSGFGDANIQQVATYRAAGSRSALIKTIRAMTGIHLVLGTVLAVLLWCVAPYVGRHVVPENGALQLGCVHSLRYACIVLWARTQETAPVSTQRAFERYGAAVRIGVTTRLLALAISGAFAFFTRRVELLMAITAVASLVAAAIQWLRIRDVAGGLALIPSFERATIRALYAFGVFSWLQAAMGVLFSQADRLLVGFTMGAGMAATYGLCVQIAQPMYGLAASGLHFLFPLIAGRRVLCQTAELRVIVLRAFLTNLAFVVFASAVLILAGPALVRNWAGASFAAASSRILPVIIWASALLALNVTATYSLLALGRVQVVTVVNLGGSAAMLAVMALLIRRGIQDFAFARLCYAGVSLLLYVPLLHALKDRNLAPALHEPLESVGERA